MKKSDEDSIFIFLFGVAVGRAFLKSPKVPVILNKPGKPGIKIPMKPGVMVKKPAINTSAKTGFSSYTIIK